MRKKTFFISKNTSPSFERWSLCVGTKKEVNRQRDKKHNVEIDGVCVHPLKQIWIRKDLNDVSTFGTLLHECVHACMPDIEERAVERVVDVFMTAEHYAYRMGLKMAFPAFVSYPWTKKRKKQTKSHCA